MSPLKTVKVVAVYTKRQTIFPKERYYWCQKCKQMFAPLGSWENKVSQNGRYIGKVSKECLTLALLLKMAAIAADLPFQKL